MACHRCSLSSGIFIVFIALAFMQKTYCPCPNSLAYLAIQSVHALCCGKKVMHVLQRTPAIMVGLVVGMQKASSGKLEDQEVGDLVNGMDPLWVLVDRVIAQKEKKGKFSTQSPLRNTAAPMKQCSHRYCEKAMHGCRPATKA